MTKAKRMFLKCMIIELKSFHNNIILLVILTHGYEFFSAKCVQFFLTFMERN